MSPLPSISPAADPEPPEHLEALEDEIDANRRALRLASEISAARWEH